MMGGTRRPFYWKNEVTGVLAQAIAAYLSDRELTGDQVAMLRAYFRQWIADDRWKGPMIDVLRTSVNEIEDRYDISRWLDRADDAGCDPL